MITDALGKYHQLTEQMFHGLLICDFEGTITYVNSRLCEILGFTESELINSNLIDAVPESERLKFEANKIELLNTKFLQVERILLRKNEKPFYAQIRFKVVGDNCIQAIVRDLTEQHQLQNQLEHSEEILLQMAEAIQDVFFLIDLTTGAFLYLSPAYETISGKSLISLKENPDDWLNSVHPDDVAQVRKMYKEQKQTGFYEGEYRIIRPDGEIRWILVRTFPVYNKSNQLVRSAGVAKDITERILATEKLHESERRFAHMLHNIELISMILDTNGCIMDCNDFLLNLTGWKREEIIEQSWFELFIPEEQKTDLEQKFQLFLANEEMLPHLDNEILTRKGDRILIHWNNSLLHSPLGEVVGTASIGEDITLRRTMEVERQQHFEEIRRGLLELAFAVNKALEQNDPYTAGHQKKVSALSVAIAQELGLSEEQITGLILAAEMHDIGKIGIPISILNKPGKLNTLEYEMIKTHTEAGYEILKNVHFPWPIAEIILQHHERLDGSGYPRGLKADHILMEAKIIAVADVVESMTAHRPYRPALGLEAALAELLKGRGILYSEEIVDVCISLFQKNRFNFDME